MFGPLGHIARMILAGKFSKRTVRFFVAKPNYDDLAALRGLIEAGQVRSVIERRYDLTQVGEAMHRLDSGHARAKTALVIP
jgi:NADPH:quinone reductase-like Zn-dependent oxidoreductase